MGTNAIQGRLIVPLAELRAGDLPVAGGKGANLGELLHAGFPVPDGFVVTTAAYAALLSETDLGVALASLTESHTPGSSADAGPPDGAAIRSAFAVAPMPEAVRDAITTAYRASGGPAVAVRSSATAEDLPGAAFAGQQDTYLDVVGEDALLEAVTTCWASLWTDRAIAYRYRQGIDPGDVAIAVVVQTMVPADVAGVLFTADPVSGRRDEMVIDASPGLGEAVVSGMVTPDHYVVAPNGRVLARSSGGSRADGDQPAGSGVGSVLTDAQLSRLASVGTRVADHFGVPQDIEWAIAEGELYLLQARPMTALPPDPADLTQQARLNPFQRKLGPFFLEMFQQRPYPLDVDGWLKHVIVAMLHRMAGSVGVAFPSLARLLPERDGVVVRLDPPVPHPTFRVLAAPLSIASRVRRYNPATWTDDPRFTAFRDSVEQLKRVNPAGLPWADLLAHIRRIFAATGAIADLRVSYLPASFVPQLPMRLVLFALGRAGLASTLLAGAVTRTEQANRGLEDLADLVRDDPELAEAFDRLEPPQLLAAIRTETTFATFLERYESFLAEFGHRETVSVVLSSSPTWADAPDAVLGIVKVLAPAPRAMRKPAADALAELTSHPALRSLRLRRLTLAAVDGARIGMAFREDSHFYLTSLLPALRRAYAEIGERLHSAGVLKQPADVYHLRFEELSGMGDPGGLTTERARHYSDLVAFRSARRRELEGVPLLDSDALFAGRPAASDVLLSGMGASRGTATGRVRVISDASGFGTLRSGEILVCPYTNPAWTPLFQRAAAVVVDAGGMGSHAAIVAREYGVPAVMGTGTGTRVLTDGQLVTVDGTRGTVTDARI